MATEAAIDRSIDTEVLYIQKVDSAKRDLNDPENRFIPMEGHVTRIRDARPIRDRLDLDEQGFILIDHSSAHAHLRDPAVLEPLYHAEHIPLIQQLSGADLVLPRIGYCRVRTSQRKPGSEGDDDSRPSPVAHADLVGKTFHDWVRWTHAEQGVELRPYRRAALYQIWRAVSEPPQDYPLGLADGRSVKPGNYVIMHNYGEGSDAHVQTRMALYDPEQLWYYFPDMTADELLVFKGYDTKFGDEQSVWHTAFDATGACPEAKPRESLEARFLAFWY